MEVGGLVLVVCLVGWFVCGSSGSLGRTVRASVGRSVSRFFVSMNSWLLDGELVGVFVGKLMG